MFSLSCVWINGWVNNREAGDLRRCHAHYDVIVLFFPVPQPLEAAVSVVSTRKANGEAAHLAARCIDGRVLICAGSKNVHMLFRNRGRESAQLLWDFDLSASEGQFLPPTAKYGVTPTILTDQESNFRVNTKNSSKYIFWIFFFMILCGCYHLKTLRKTLCQNDVILTWFGVVITSCVHWGYASAQTNNDDVKATLQVSQITGPLWGNPPRTGEFPTQRDSNVVLSCLLLARSNFWINSRVTGDLRRHDADVTSL